MFRYRQSLTVKSPIEPRDWWLTDITWDVGPYPANRFTDTYQLILTVFDPDDANPITPSFLH